MVKERIKWEDLNGTEQMVVEASLGEIKKDIILVLGRWANEYMDANDELGFYEPVDIEKCREYIVWRLEEEK